MVVNHNNICVVNEYSIIKNLDGRVPLESKWLSDIFVQILWFYDI